MNNKVYFLTDDSCEPLDPDALSIESMDRNLFIERYGNTDWTFGSCNEAVKYIHSEIRKD